MKPYVGQTVHYVARGSADGRFAPACRAAVLTEVGAWVTGNIDTDPDMRNRVLTQHWDPNACGVVVLNPTGQFFHPSSDSGCRHDTGSPAGSGTGAHCPVRDRTYPGGTWHHLENAEAPPAGRVEVPVIDEAMVADAPPQVSVLANTIGYVLADRRVAITADDAIAAAKRLVSQGLVNPTPSSKPENTEG